MKYLRLQLHSSFPINFLATYGNAQVVLTWNPSTFICGSAITAYKLYWGTASGNEPNLIALGNNYYLSQCWSNQWTNLLLYR